MGHTGAERRAAVGGARVSSLLVEVAARCEEPFGAAVGAHARAVAAGDGALLSEAAEAAEAFAAIGIVLPAVEASTQAASAYHAAGRRAPALTAAARAQVLAGACEGARTPVLAAADVTEAGLTRREREVASLAALGSSNQEIADKPYTSVRTVEGHMLRTFSKLGISSRLDLPTAIGLTPRGDAESPTRTTPTL